MANAGPGGNLRIVLRSVTEVVVLWLDSPDERCLFQKAGFTRLTPGWADKPVTKASVAADGFHQSRTKGSSFSVKRKT